MFIRTAVLAVFYLLILVCLIPVLLVCVLFGARQPLLTIGRETMRLSRTILGFHLSVEGLDRIDRTRPAVFMSNHASFLDGPLLFLLIPLSLRIIMKKSVFRIPVVGQGMHFVGFVPVDRGGGQNGRVSIERAAVLIRDRKYSFLIFPEGTRTPDGILQAFRRGGFFLAVQSGAPLIPVSIGGTFALMPRGRRIPKRGPISVVFHPPLPTAGISAEEIPALMARVRQAIASGLKGERP